MYPHSITKYVDGVSTLNAATLNAPLYELENRTDHIKTSVDTLLDRDPKLVLTGQPIKASVSEYTLVSYTVNNQWELSTGRDKTQLGVAKNISGAKADIYLLGRVTTMAATIIEASGVVEVGVPYYASVVEPGRITSCEPAQPIHVGTFIDSSTFIVHTQNNSTMHTHRRTKLDSTKWVNHTTYLLYPEAQLSQLPMPYESLVMIMGMKYNPYYGMYSVDSTGIKITDISGMETLLGIGAGTLFATISAASYVTEVYWSDPKSLTPPGVMTLHSETDNLVIRNNIPSQPTSSGSLKISCIPEVADVSVTNLSNVCVKDILVNPTTGTLELVKGGVVSSITAGDNVSITNNVISANLGIIQTQVCTDINLNGAWSEVYPGTIHSYIKFLPSCYAAPVFTAYLPSNIDLSKQVAIYATYFGTSAISLKYSMTLDMTKASSALSLTFDEAMTLQRKKLISFLPEMTSVVPPLYIQLEREASVKDVFGVVSVSVEYTAQ